MSTRLSWTDVEAIVRIADADPAPELREIATDTLAWLPLDEPTGRRVLGVLADEAPPAWRDALDHHLWLLSQESPSSPAGQESGMDRPEAAMTAIVLLPDHLFDEADVMDLSVLRGLPDIPARWLLTTLLRRLLTAPADEPALGTAVTRVQRIIDVLPDTAEADLVLAPAPAADRHALAGAALAVARPGAVLAALLPWVRSPTPTERRDALRTLRAAARFLGQPQLFGASTPGPRDALADLAAVLRRTPGGPGAGPDQGRQNEHGPEPEHPNRAAPAPPRRGGGRSGARTRGRRTGGPATA